MNKRKVMVLSVALLCGLLLAGLVRAMSLASYAINWDVIGGGGGPISSASYALNSTIGQAVVGVATDANDELCSGFWCGAAAEYSIYLPLVLRNFS